MAEVAPERALALDALAEAAPARLFGDHPFQSPPDVASRHEALVRGAGLRSLLDLE